MIGTAYALILPETWGKILLCVITDALCGKYANTSCVSFSCSVIVIMCVLGLTGDAIANATKLHISIKVKFFFRFCGFRFLSFNAKTAAMKINAITWILEY